MAEELSEEDGTLAVLDLDKFCAAMIDVLEDTYGGAVRQSVAPWQVRSLLTEHNAGYTDDGQPLVNFQTMKELQSAMFSLHLSRTISDMAAEGIIDCAWDDEANEPIFKLSEDAIKRFNAMYKYRKNNNNDDKTEE